MHRQLVTKLSIAAIATAGLLIPQPLEGGTSAQPPPPQFTASSARAKPTPAIRQRIYKQLVEAQDLADRAHYAQALDTLSSLLEHRDLTPYETAQTHVFTALVHFRQDNYQAAIESYELALAQPGLPDGLLMNALYALGQLHLTSEDYPQAVGVLEQWFALAPDAGPRAHALLAQAHYHMKQYRDALLSLDEALDIADDQGKPVLERWLTLKRVCHYELRDLKGVADVLEELLARFPKREYWNQLSSVYGELGNRSRQLATLELALLQGYLDRPQDFVNLSQLLMMNGDPFRAGVILEKAIGEEVVPPTLDNLKLLGQAWTAAKETDRGLIALHQAAQLADHGELDLRIAYLLIDAARFDEAAQAAREALRKGGLKTLSEAYMLLGTALYYADRLDEAKAAFANVRTPGGTKWRAHLEREAQRRLALERAKSAKPAYAGSM